MIQFLPLILAGLSAAGSIMSATREDTGQGTPTPSGGGTIGGNPTANFFEENQPGDLNAIGPPKPLSTLPAEPIKTSTAAPTEKLEPIDMASLPKRREEVAKDQEVGDLLASIPEALALAAPLLGLVDEDKRKQTAPVSGASGQNQYAGAFGALPKPPTLGELLASMPRLGR